MLQLWLMMWLARVQEVGVSCCSPLLCDVCCTNMQLKNTCCCMLNKVVGCNWCMWYLQILMFVCRYALTCCSWFAKDFPRLLAGKASHNWDPYDVEELRGKTLGVVGYGDIGRATAQLAKAFKLKITALRRNTALSAAEQEEGILVSCWCYAKYMAVPS